MSHVVERNILRNSKNLLVRNFFGRKLGVSLYSLFCRQNRLSRYLWIKVCLCLIFGCLNTRPKFILIIFQEPSYFSFALQLKLLEYIRDQELKKARTDIVKNNLQVNTARRTDLIMKFAESFWKGKIELPLCNITWRSVVVKINQFQCMVRIKTIL